MIGEIYMTVEETHYRHHYWDLSYKLILSTTYRDRADVLIFRLILVPMRLVIEIKLCDWSFLKERRENTRSDGPLQSLYIVLTLQRPLDPLPRSGESEPQPASICSTEPAYRTFAGVLQTRTEYTP
jgi:hypothetical protein